jgi:hypothetical protein
MTSSLTLDASRLTAAIDFISGYAALKAGATASFVQGHLWANTLGVTQCKITDVTDHPSTTVVMPTLLRVSNGVDAITLKFSETALNVKGKGTAKMPISPIPHIHTKPPADLARYKEMARSVFELTPAVTRMIRAYRSNNRTMAGVALLNGNLVATDAVAAVFVPQNLTTTSAYLPARLFDVDTEVTVYEQANNELAVIDEHGWYLGLRSAYDPHPVFGKVAKVYARAYENLANMLTFWPADLLEALKPWSAEDQALHVQADPTGQAILSLKSAGSQVTLEIPCSATGTFEMTIPIAPLLKFMAFAPPGLACTLGVDPTSPVALCLFEEEGLAHPALMLTRTL